ncbi:MAG: hypothetical protein RLZ88_161 [Actinomycetota bacterium]|jgi:hypothetical protein
MPTAKGSKIALADDSARTALGQLYEPARLPNGKFIEPRILAEVVAKGAVEIMAGIREASQLADLLADDVYVLLRDKASQAKLARIKRGELPQRPTFKVTSSRIQQPQPNAIEAVVILQGPSRVRAVTLRIVKKNDRWKVAAVAIL